MKHKTFPKDPKIYFRPFAKFQIFDIGPVYDLSQSAKNGSILVDHYLRCHGSGKINIFCQNFGQTIAIFN